MPRYASFAYAALIAVVPPLWLVLLLLAGAYDQRVMCSGAVEYQRVGNAGLWLLVAFAAAALLVQADISRSITFFTMILTTNLTIGARFAARKHLHRLLAGEWDLHQVVLVGPGHDTLSLARHMRSASYAGFKVVAVCPTDAS
jgi:FlaA1/EpsC-like NDP-sugar epimerase